MILHPAKTKSMLLATRQKHQLRPLVLNLNLKDNHIEQVHGPGTLALSSTMNLVGDPTLLAHAKQYKKQQQKKPTTNKPKNV